MSSPAHFINRMTATVPRLIKKLGYSAIRSTGELPPHVAEIRHAPVLPFKATYSPWLNDSSFMAAFTRVRSNTLVDILRCYDLWSLVRQSAKLETGALIEVGVWRGGTGCLIAEAARQARLHEPVYLCDTFSGVVKAGPMDTSYKGGEHSDTSRELVDKLASDMGLRDVIVLKGIFPDDTARGHRHPILSLSPHRRGRVRIYEGNHGIRLAAPRQRGHRCF
jgi:hypothetical protein